MIFISFHYNIVSLPLLRAPTKPPEHNRKKVHALPSFTLQHNGLPMASACTIYNVQPVPSVTVRAVTVAKAENGPESVRGRETCHGVKALAAGTWGCDGKEVLLRGACGEVGRSHTGTSFPNLSSVICCLSFSYYLASSEFLSIYCWHSKGQTCEVSYLSFTLTVYSDLIMLGTNLY